MLSLVAKKTHNGVVITDKYGKIQYVNKGFERMVGYELEQVEGLSPDEFLLGEETDLNHVRNIRSAILRKEEVSQELLIYDVVGNPFWISCSVSPDLNAVGRIARFVAVLTDITEVKSRELQLETAKQKAEESVKLKENFLSNMSHEIRNPMTAVLGFATMLMEDEALNEKQHTFVQNIHNAAEGLLNVLNDILDFSKINSEKLTFETINFDLHHLFQQLQSTLKLRAETKGIDLFMNLEEGLPTKVAGDPTRLNQILMNIVGNAVKFTEVGYVSVKAQLLKSREHGPEIVVDVMDTGVGIPKEKLDSIFEEFQQATNYISRKFGGSGLGLSISKKLIEMFGGKLLVESKEGRGSTFSFTIQLQKAKDEVDRISTINEAGLSIKRRLKGLEQAKNILVVDDNEMNRIIACEFLEKAGFATATAADGLQAVQAVQERGHELDLILMDVQMPNMNGIEATRQIREMDTRIPILAMTASLMKHDLRKCFEVGMVDAIEKPIKREQMFAAIATSLEIRKAS